MAIPRCVYDLTFEEAHRLLSYDPITGVFMWKIRTSNRTKMDEEAGGFSGKGYKCIRVNKQLYRCHRLAWFMTYGVWPEKELDHIDRNRANNAISNLRECSGTQNQGNRNNSKNTQSGLKGVYAVNSVKATSKKWMAQITYRGITLNLGSTHTKKEAAELYDSAAKRLFGDFAHTNADAGVI